MFDEEAGVATPFERAMAVVEDLMRVLDAAQRELAITRAERDLALRILGAPLTDTAVEVKALVPQKTVAAVPAAPTPQYHYSYTTERVCRKCNAIYMPYINPENPPTPGTKCHQTVCRSCRVKVYIANGQNMADHAKKAADDRMLEAADEIDSKLAGV